MHDFNARNTRILTDFVQNMRFWVHIRYYIDIPFAQLLYSLESGWLESESKQI